MLTEDYMSSEESDTEDGKIVYVIKTIPWESNALKRKKKILDKIYKKGQSKRSQERAVKRVRREGALSLHEKPDNCPKWACLDE